jgi:asparagine synthase (glutamine-hydrolysing)
MCGIAGILKLGNNEAKIDEQELLALRDRMANRGPDGAGLWMSQDRSVGLAHRRLSIIDLSESASQPMRDASANYHITFNGEIYNYRELRAQLEREGHAFRTESDTEVLLALYIARGEEMLTQLRGMFAFAIWDEPRKSLFMARDPFGIKPLYYSRQRTSLRFASQAKALAEAAGCVPSAEAAGYAGFLLWGYVPEPFSLYKDIFSLPAGSFLRATRDRIEIRPYFSLNSEIERAHATATTSDAEELVGALSESVRYHMVADVPVAAFLSAGLDSSAVVSLAADQENLNTFTLGFSEYRATANDETGPASEMAAQLGVPNTVSWISRMDFDQEFERLMQFMDQPSTDGVNTYLVSRAAARSGIKVALSGLGGDELFGGYPSFKDVPRIVALSSRFPYLRKHGVALRRAAAPTLRRFTSPKFASLFEYGSSYPGAYALRRGLFMPWELPEVLDADFAAEGLERLQTIQALSRCVPGGVSSRALISSLEMQWYMRCQLLRDSDWAGMAHSLEIRVPFVDVPFVRTVLSAIVGRQPPTKLDITNRLPTAVPETILHRAKTGFLAPVQEWCRLRSSDFERDRGLRSWAKMVLSNAAHSDVVVHRRPRPRHGGSSRSPQTSPPVRGQPEDRLVPRIKAAAARQSYATINSSLRLLARAIWPGRMPAEARKICVFRIGNIGDVVCALPAVSAIRNRFPKAHITLLTSPGKPGAMGAEEVLGNSQLVDDIWTYYSEDIKGVRQKLAMARKVREQHFDLWIDLPNNLTTLRRQLRDMVFVATALIPWARGWRVDTLRWAAQAQSLHINFPDEVDRLLAIVRDAGFDASSVDFAMSPKAQIVSSIDKLLAHNRVAGPIVAIAPGAKRSTNLWPRERFMQVAAALHDRGYAVLIVGGSSDAELCSAVASGTEGAISLAGDLSLEQSCELLRRCKFAVCLDSGVQHLASAVGTPCISLFSSWQMRGKWHPHGARNVVLQKWVSCHTCLREICPHDNFCMRLLEGRQVNVSATRCTGASACA